MHFNKPEYFLGVDTYDKYISCYCLMKRVGDSIEVVISKRMRNSFEFFKEVDNLSKYFNATVFKSN